MDDCSRRIFAIEGAFGEGPFTIPFADLYQCKPVGFATYALAGRLRARAKAWLPDRSAPPTRIGLSFATSRAVLEMERDQPPAHRIVGQISPNAVIVSSADTPSPANGRTMIEPIPARRNSITRAATSSFVPASVSASTCRSVISGSNGRYGEMPSA
jgi:hypothetical protein